MKNILIILFTNLCFSQTVGINYQALIINPNPQEIPGENRELSPLVNAELCLRFSLLDVNKNIEYQEIQTIKTDDFGMINTVIGIGTAANSISSIDWSDVYKYLTVEVDVTNSCEQWKILSEQQLNYVPYSFFSNRANNVTGIVAIKNGGTNATTVSQAKINFGLNNVDNTSDLNKPLSNASTNALLLKENISNKSSNTNLGSSDILFPTQNAVKSYVDSRLSSTSEIKEIVFYAKENESIFPTPEVFGDVSKIHVYRNGIKINVINIDFNKIKIENSIKLDLNDEIKIIQFK
jgi:hypothetical protein